MRIIRDGLVCTLVAARVAIGQGPCPGNAPVTATLGIGSYTCNGPCAIGLEDDTGLHHRFSVEPRLGAIARGGPSSGVLRDGDVLVAVNGTLITTPAAGHLLANLRPGPITMRVRRDGVETDATVIAVRGCNVSTLVVTMDSGTGARIEPAAVSFGMSIACGDCGWRRKPNGGRVFYTRRLPVVTAVAENGPAARAGIRPGDVLVTVDGMPLLEASAGDLLGRATPGDTLQLGFRRELETHVVRIVLAVPGPEREIMRF